MYSYFYFLTLGFLRIPSLVNSQINKKATKKYVNGCYYYQLNRNTRPKMFLGKGERLYATNLPMPKCELSPLIEVALRHGCSPVSLLHIFRTSFPKNSSGWLLLT